MNRRESGGTVEWEGGAGEKVELQWCTRGEQERKWSCSGVGRVNKRKNGVAVE